MSNSILYGTDLFIASVSENVATIEEDITVLILNI